MQLTTLIIRISILNFHINQKWHAILNQKDNVSILNTDLFFYPSCHHVLCYYHHHFRIFPWNRNIHQHGVITITKRFIETMYSKFICTFSFCDVCPFVLNVSSLVLLCLFALTGPSLSDFCKRAFLYICLVWFRKWRQRSPNNLTIVKAPTPIILLGI